MPTPAYSVNGHPATESEFRAWMQSIDKRQITCRDGRAFRNSTHIWRWFYWSCQGQRATSLFKLPKIDHFD